MTTPSDANDQLSPEAREIYYAGLWQSPTLRSTEPNPTEAERLRIIQSLLGKAFGDRKSDQRQILDAGCGRGWLCPYLSEWGTTLGIDPLRSSIDSARTLFPGLTFEIATVEQLEGNTFDLVLSSEVIEHTDDHAAYIRGIAKVMTAGGFLILTMPRAEVYAKFTQVFPRHLQQPVENWLDRTTLLESCRRAGLELVAEHRIFELFTTKGAWRLFGSPRVSRFMNSTSLTSTWLKRLKDSHALYFCGLFRKAQ